MSSQQCFWCVELTHLVPPASCGYLLQADRLGGSAMFDAGAHLGDLQTEALSLQVQPTYVT